MVARRLTLSLSGLLLPTPPPWDNSLVRHIVIDPARWHIVDFGTIAMLAANQDKDVRTAKVTLSDSESKS